VGRTGWFAPIAALVLAESCVEQAGTLLASFGFLCAVGGPISFAIVLAMGLTSLRDRARERRRLRAPSIACADAPERIGQRVAISGRIEAAEPLRDPITGESVAHYDIAAGGAKAMPRHIAVGALRPLYGVVKLTDIERDVRSATIQIVDDTGAITVIPEEMSWLHVEPRPEEDPLHASSRASWLARRRADAVWLVHRQVPIGAEVVAIGELRERSVQGTAAGYRGGAPRTEIHLAGPAMIVRGTSFAPVLRALDYREVASTFAVGAVITLGVTALGILPFLVAWLSD
jgi:hypothetical protein